MGKMTVIIMILTVITKIFGFVRESVMAAVIGAGEIKSIYVTSTTIPDIMMYTVVAGIVSAYIPIYTKVKNDRGDEKADLFTSNLINVLMACGIIVFVLIVLFAGSIAKIFSPKLSGSSLEMAISWTRIMSVSIFTFLYSSVMRGYLNAKGNFIDPVISGLILNVIIISSTIMTGTFNNPYILIIGTLIANVLQFIRFPFASRKRGFKYSLKINFADPDINRMILIMIPVIISSAANKISLLVDKSMASAYVGIDGVAKVFYTENMLDFIVEVITLTIATITFPEIANFAHSKKLDKMKEKLSSSAILTMALVIPATFGLMALANPIIKLAYERHAFTSVDTSIVASLIVSYGPYIIFISFMRILSNAFYAIGDSRSPLIIILIQQVINFVLNIILVKQYGIDGLAYATSISTAVASIIISVVYYIKFDKFDYKESLSSLIKIVLSSFIMAAIAYSLHFKVMAGFNLIISLAISIIIPGIIYLILIYFANVKEIQKFINIAKTRVGFGRRNNEW